MAYLTTRDVAERFKVSERTVRRWCRGGAIPTVRFGRAHRIPEEALNALLVDAPAEPQTAWLPAEAPGGAAAGENPNGSEPPTAAGSTGPRAEERARPEQPRSPRKEVPPPRIIG